MLSAVPTKVILRRKLFRTVIILNPRQAIRPEYLTPTIHLSSFRQSTLATRFPRLFQAIQMFSNFRRFEVIQLQAQTIPVK